MADSKAETITLRLEQQIDAAADAATGALGRLERQIGREENALSRLEKSLVDAQRKLVVMSEGAVDKRAVAAYEKQAAAAGLLAQKLAAGKASAEQLAAAQAKLATMKDAASAKSVDVTAYKKQETAIASLVDKIGSQRDKLSGLRDKVTESKGATAQLAEATKLLGDKAGLTGSQTAMLGKELAALGPYGAIAAGAVLLAVGAVAAFVSIVAKGINAAGAMRTELLKLQTSSVASSMGMHWLFNATRESADGAARMQKSIDKVNASSSLGRAKLAEYAAQINAARFTGAKAETVLKAMSIAGSAGSESMAKDVLSMAKAYRFAGASVDNLAQRVEQKLGRAAMSQAIALETQMRRLGENITWIFGGADIDPFLRAMNTVLSLFNAGGKEATTMRDMVTRLVEWSIGGMLKMGIAVLKAYIALREQDSAWRAIVNVVKLAAYGLAAVVVIATVVTASVVALGAALFALQMAVIGAAGSLVKLLVGALKALNEAVAGVLVSIGVAIVDGISNGIVSAGDKIWQSLKSVVGGAVGKVKGLLGIASPSKVGVDIGHNFGSSIGLGEAKSEHAVVGATAHMTEAMIATSSGSAANDVAPAAERPSVTARVSTGGDGKSVTFTNCTFGGNLTQHEVRQWVLDAFEGTSVAGRSAS